MSRKPARLNHLARIHILKADLRLDDDQYRAVLWTVGRVESSKDLDTHGREAVIKHLQAHVDARGGTYPGRPGNFDKRGEMRKIEALLTDAGKPWAYAVAMARRMYGKERLEFCSPGDLAGIVAALHKQALKRLSQDLQAVFGEHWPGIAQDYAVSLFGLPLDRAVEKDPRAMSQVLRWWRNELPAFSVWPRQAPLNG